MEMNIIVQGGVIMNLTFKATLQKKWTLLDEKIIYGDKELLFDEIESVRMFGKASIVTNGVIQVKLKNRSKIINLVYPYKLNEQGKEAFEYLQENCGDEKETFKKEFVSRIQSEINSLPCRDEWGTRKEISELHNILNDNEHIKALTSGLTEGNTWLIVCTNRRVLMMDKGMIYGLKLIDIPLDRINSISHSKGLVLGKIAITDGAMTRTIENVSNTSISYFVDTVNKEVELFKESKKTVTIQQENTTSAADEILKYKNLLDIGALTQDEFNRKKKELLGL